MSMGESLLQRLHAGLRLQQLAGLRHFFELVENSRPSGHQGRVLRRNGSCTVYAEGCKRTAPAVLWTKQGAAARFREARAF